MQPPFVWWSRNHKKRSWVERERVRFLDQTFSYLILTAVCIMQKPSVHNLNMCNNVSFSCHFISGMTVWQPSRMSAWRVCIWGNAMQVDIWFGHFGLPHYRMVSNEMPLLYLKYLEIKQKNHLWLYGGILHVVEGFWCFLSTGAEKKLFPRPNSWLSDFLFLAFRLSCAFLPFWWCHGRRIFGSRVTGLPKKKILPASPLPFSQIYIYIQRRRESDQYSREQKKSQSTLMTIKRNGHRAMSNSTKTVSLPSAVLGGKRIGPSPIPSILLPPPPTFQSGMDDRSDGGGTMDQEGKGGSYHQTIAFYCSGGDTTLSILLQYYTHRKKGDVKKKSTFRRKAEIVVFPNKETELSLINLYIWFFLRPIL